VPSAEADGSLETAPVDSKRQSYQRRIVGVSREIDLAVIKVDAEKLPALPLAVYRKLGQGEIVFCLRESGRIAQYGHDGGGFGSGRARTEPGFANDLQSRRMRRSIPGIRAGPLVNVNGRSGGSEYFYSVAIGRKTKGWDSRSRAMCGERRLPAIAEVRPLATALKIGIGIQTITPSMAGGPLGLPRTLRGGRPPTSCPAARPEAAGVQIGDVSGGRGWKSPRTILPLVAFHFLFCWRRETKSIWTSFGGRTGWLSRSR